MKTRNTFTLTATLMIALIALVAIGCSSNNPVSGNSGVNSVSGDNNGSFRAGASVEWYGLATMVNPETNELGISSQAGLIVVAEGAEIVYKDGGNETPITISEINVGDSLEARGDIQGDGSLLADRVRVRAADDNNNNDTELHGRVESIDAAGRTMTLVGFPNLINVLPTAEVVHKVSSGTDLPIGLDEIIVGDSVEVRGTLQSDNSLSADRVRLRDEEDHHSDLEFKTTITSIDYENGTMTVASRPETILIDANTFIYAELDSDSVMNITVAKVTTDGGDDDGNDDDDDKVKTRLSITHLTVGDSVEVYADIIDASTLYAVAIELEDGAFESQNEVEFKDVLAMVDVVNGWVTFENQTMTGIVVGTTKLWGYQNETITLDMFNPGEIVEVHGFAVSETEFQIILMEKENNF
ncbi:MAG: hypothetical protein DWP97_02140 [Calditrichaeota bacterium]|nr:MAG: hypothetical protein DWP97_02140 [Calditrichota bacterium]